jgi:PKD repeat protein
MHQPLLSARQWALFFATFVYSIGLTAQSTPISGIINRYAAVTAYDSCGGLLTVSDTNGFAIGGRILVHHTKGGTINESNTGQYGTITDLGNTGRYEVALVVGRSAQQLVLERQLRYPPLPDAVVQIVTYPTYANAIVTDTVRPYPWDGTVGGIVALEVLGSLTLDAPIVADGAGFVGGTSFVANNNNCTWVVGESGYFYASGNWRGGNKGEGIVEGTVGQELGRGPRANGGGGGNDHNAGGGGGGNTANGGQGGNNNEPATFGCDGFFPGLGGRAIGNSSGRLFMGGGGGSGHTNNLLTSDGGNGGGLIFVSANSISGNNPKISANGGAGTNSGGDGGGGGGAGGSIWLKTNFLATNAIVRAIGGNGGTASGQSGNRCFGPGGGGSGGRITTNAIGTVLVQGGAAGTVVQSTNSCNGTSNGATAGQDGQTPAFETLPTGVFLANLPLIQQQPTNQILCAGDNLALEIQTFPSVAVGFQWQELLDSDWTNLPNAEGNNWTLPNIQPSNGTRFFRVVADGGNCFFFTSDIAEIDVVPSPIASFSAQNLGNGMVAFDAQLTNVTGGPLWNFGDGGTASNTAAPVHTYNTNGAYSVQLTAWNNCDTVVVTQNITVALPPAANFVVADSTEECNSVTLIFTNTTTDAASYAWTFPGGEPPVSTDTQPSITYTQSGNYTATLIATNAAGNDTISQNFYVGIGQFPVADYTATDLPNGTGVQFTFTGSGAVAYVWDFGDGSPNSTEANPIHLFPPGDETYKVRLLVVNECGASVLELEITVDDESVSTHFPWLNWGWALYPNPTTGAFSLRTPHPVARVEVSDATGRLVAVMGAQSSYQLGNVPDGVYFIRVFVDGGSWVGRLCLVK